MPTQQLKGEFEGSATPQYDNSFMHSSSQSTIHDENGWGMGVTVDRDVASSWETFRLWRVSDSEFQLRTSQWQSLTWDNERMAWGIRLLFPHLSYLLSAATSIPSPNQPSHTHLLHHASFTFVYPFLFLNLHALGPIHALFHHQSLKPKKSVNHPW